MFHSDNGGPTCTRTITQIALPQPAPLCPLSGAISTSLHTVSILVHGNTEQSRTLVKMWWGQRAGSELEERRRVSDSVCARVCAFRYLHKEHDFYDLDDELEELGEKIDDGPPTSSDRSVVANSSQSVRSEGDLVQCLHSARVLCLHLLGRCEESDS